MDIKEAIQFLKDRYKMGVMSHSADHHWVHLLNIENNVGCMLLTKDDNTCFQFYTSLAYGEFKYSELSIQLLGKASDLAYKRVWNVARNIAPLDV